MSGEVMAEDLMIKLVALCKRRGFVFPSSEIYGGVASTYDYGPLGVELKRAVREDWWRTMTQRRTDVVGLDAAILMHPDVWTTSGHVESFTDPMADCRQCKRRWRLDETEGTCPHCGGELTEARQFNLMFRTFMGPVETDASVVYLRPETAQGIYVNFLSTLNTSRKKVPFGIAQIGKAFRNEITPGNFIFRTREFEQMEMQFFVRPDEDQKWFDYWLDLRLKWYRDLGIREEKLRVHPHADEELAHYAKTAVDVEYEYPFGWKELEGVHNRTDFDLARHAEATGKDMSYFDDQTKERFVPYIIETSAGVDRTVLTLLVEAYDEDPELDRVLLRFHPKVAPITVGVFPLVRKAGMPERAQHIAEALRKHLRVFEDHKGSIGRRYRRMDEAGTPYCVTVDGQTMEDDTVTVRYRDATEQDRVSEDALARFIEDKLDEPWVRPALRWTNS
jgi:glycyl-tRNA synthetase